MVKTKSQLAVMFYKSKNIHAYIWDERQDWKNPKEQVFISIGDLNIQVSKDEINLRASLAVKLGLQTL
tara:strand:+ start:836 stop:1039 length:204 start_codon:yes stop_codon:yes gene_type:complete